MAIADNTFTGWCCSLVSGEAEIAGTLVDITELQLPISREQLHRQLSGLSLRVNDITTTYALITCHSVLPGSASLNQWKFSEKFLGRQATEKTLDEYVSGMISCCGPDSFVIPSDTVATEHYGNDCSLGLNFTVLFLNEDFKQHYCAHYGTDVKPPTVALSQCEDDIHLIYQHLPQAQDSNIAPGVEVVSLQPSFIVITASCNEIPLNAIEVISERGREQCLPDLQLCQEITRFDRMKSVRCVVGESASSHPPIGKGMPLVYRNDNDNNSLKLIGMVTEHGKALILSCLLQLLKGMYNAINV